MVQSRCWKYQNQGVLLYRIGRCTSHKPPLWRFPKLDCSTTKTVPRVPLPNDRSPESSRRDASNAHFFGTATSPTVEISRMENRPRGGVMYTVAYGRRGWWRSRIFGRVITAAHVTNYYTYKTITITFCEHVIRRKDRTRESGRPGGLDPW